MLSFLRCSQIIFPRNFGAHGGQKKAQDLLELELKTVMPSGEFWEPTPGSRAEPLIAKPALQSQSPYFLRQHPFTKPELPTLARLIGCELQGLLCLPLCTGLTFIVSLDFYIVTVDPSPGPHACKAGTSPTEPSPQLYFPIIKKWLPQ